MKRMIVIAVLLVALLADNGYQRRTINRQRTRIADLEERNEALSRLCGPDPTREPYQP